jgi:hypothetical protein
MSRSGPSHSPVTGDFAGSNPATTAKFLCAVSVNAAQQALNLSREGPSPSRRTNVPVVEQADTQHLKRCAARHEGSIPSRDTKFVAFGDVRIHKSREGLFVGHLESNVALSFSGRTAGSQPVDRGSIPRTATSGDVI